MYVPPVLNTVYKIFPSVTAAPNSVCAVFTLTREGEKPSSKPLETKQGETLLSTRHLTAVFIGLVCV